MTGCESQPTTSYRTLNQTYVNVSWQMTGYRNAAYFGRLTLQQRQAVDQAYADYKAAFDHALQMAGGHMNAPTPDYVKDRANELIRLISSIQVPP